MTARVNEADAVNEMRLAGLEPLENYPGTHQPWKSQCSKCKNFVHPRLASIRAGQGPCKFCAGHRTPEMAEKEMLKMGFRPLGPFPGTNKNWKCECTSCGEVSTPRMANVLNGSRCFTCSNTANGQKRRTPPEIALAEMKKANLTPITPYVDGATPWLSRCNNCDRLVSPRLSSVKKGRACAFCSKRRINPEEAAEILRDLGAEPKAAYPGSKNPWPATCKNCERAISPRFADARRDNSVCPFCSGSKVDPEDALAVLKEKGLEPLVDYPGSGQPWKCTCLRCGNETAPTFSSLKSGSRGCANCAGQRVSQSQALSLFLKCKIKPLVEKYPGSKVPWPSICQVCENEISPTYGSLLRGSGCRFCSVAGIKYLAPGFVYFITNTQLNAHKIGIANTKSNSQYHDRLKQHTARGWILIEKVEFSNTKLAYDLEQGLLDWIRIDLGLPHYLPSSSMPQGGYTETFSNEVSIEAVRAKIAQIMKSNRAH